MKNLREILTEKISKKPYNRLRTYMAKVEKAEETIEYLEDLNSEEVGVLLKHLLSRKDFKFAEDSLSEFTKDYCKHCWCVKPTDGSNCPCINID